MLGASGVMAFLSGLLGAAAGAASRDSVLLQLKCAGRSAALRSAAVLCKGSLLLVRCIGSTTRGRYFSSCVKLQKTINFHSSVRIVYKSSYNLYCIQLTHILVIRPSGFIKKVHGRGSSG